MTHFARKVLGLTAKIPRGKISTYKLIAGRIGNEQSARAVANVLAKNRNYNLYPCHRVVKSDGQLGEYNRGQKLKKKLLLREGILISKNNIILLKNYLYKF